ncbi:MAG: hypothetical protein ACFCGT_04480 [Sandaracinaceae bacterium]
MRHRSSVLLFFVLVLGGCGSTSPSGDGGAPGPDSGGREPPPGADGAACGADAECLGGTCLEGADFPGGLCTLLGCASDADCRGGGVCVTDPAVGVAKCHTPCTTDGDCRAGFVCSGMLGTLACWPDRPAMAVEGPDGVPGTVTCVGPVEGQEEIAFEVPVGTTRYAVVPFAEDGGRVVPLLLDGPDRDLDFASDESVELATVTSTLLGFTSPLVVPPKPGRETDLQSGSHAFVVDADTENLCLYLVAEDAPGRRLDLNIYLVGIEGREPATAGDDPALQRMTATVDEVFGQVDLPLGEVRYLPLSPEDTSAFRVITVREDIAALAALSTPPEGGPDALLSLNVFLLAGLDLPEGSVVGISQGIPGPPGLHGSMGSGVVVSAEFLDMGVAGDPLLGAELTGLVLAHEAGHFLGLFHTTEASLAVSDPLADTPVCTGGFPDDCPDQSNLMFPLASLEGRGLTAQQGAVLAANPLARP